MTPVNALGIVPNAIKNIYLCVRTVKNIISSKETYFSSTFHFVSFIAGSIHGKENFKQTPSSKCYDTKF